MIYTEIQIIAKVIELDERIRLQAIEVRNAESYRSAMLSTARRTPEVDATIARSREELTVAEDTLKALKAQRAHWWTELEHTDLEIPGDVDLRIPAGPAVLGYVHVHDDGSYMDDGVDLRVPATSDGG